MAPQNFFNGPSQNVSTVSYEGNSSKVINIGDFIQRRIHDKTKQTTM
jgi:hypothetical protein